MKPINEMSLSECLESFFECLEAQRDGEWQWTGIRELTAIRLSQLSDRIHDLTRWIPISERMPTKEDADESGYVLVHGTRRLFLNVRQETNMWYWDAVTGAPIGSTTLTHWRRIDTP